MNYDSTVFKDITLPTVVQQYMHLSRYSRWSDTLKRRESWYETVKRYLDFMAAKVEEMGYVLTEEEYLRQMDAILNLKAMPSMRALMSAGPALDDAHVACYNCAFACVNHPKMFSEAMYILMCGTGLGYSVERQEIAKLPEVQPVLIPSDTIIVFRDSKIGWAQGYQLIIDSLYNGEIPKWDLSRLRPAGARLKKFGGRASGPQPLEELILLTIETFKRAAGRKLNSLEIHGIMCKIGDCVVSGGVRRSALLSLSNLSDDRMRNAKSGEWWKYNPHFALANNSVAYEEKPDMERFFDEWLSLYKSKSGERGIFNREGAKKLTNQIGRRNGDLIKGVNPCISDTTWIQTLEGPRQVKDLIDTPFTAIVDGKYYKSTDKGFFSTGNQPIYRLHTQEGYTLEVTSNHQIMTISGWKEAGKLVNGDEIVLNNHQDISWNGFGTLEEGWLTGSVLGDGNITKSGYANVDFWGSEKESLNELACNRIQSTVGCRSNSSGCISTKHDRSRVGSSKLGKFIESFGLVNGSKLLNDNIEITSSDFHVGFLRGWFDADGSVQGNHFKGTSIRLASVSKENLLRAQRMLLRLGIVSTVHLRKRGGERSLPNGKGGYSLYYCKDSYELIISNEAMVVYANRIGFESKTKKEKLDSILLGYKRKINQSKFTCRYVESELIGIKPVFDCTIPEVSAFDANGLYVHNCAEILMRDCGFCNLSEVVVRVWDTLETLCEKVRLAVQFGVMQSCFTDFKYIRSIWKRNADEERLLGVSLTGIMDHEVMSGVKGLDELTHWLETMKAVAQEEAKKWSERLGINMPAAITCVKPSGSVSQLVNSSSGIHPRYSRYYVRTYRENKISPICSFFENVGIPYEPAIGKESMTSVFEFPVESPATSVTRDQITAIQQLELWKIYKHHWAEHTVSVTVYVREHEWLEVGAWVYKNFDDITGISFLPYDTGIYKQAPYQPIEKDTYEKLCEKFPTIDWSSYAKYEKSDMTESSRELACSAGHCEL